MEDLKAANAWIEQNVDDGLKAYVRMACFHQLDEEDVLKRNRNGKYKSIRQIGIPISDRDVSQKMEEWMDIWEAQAEYIAGKTAGMSVKLFESHAHYNRGDFSGSWRRLLELMHDVGRISHIIMPAVEYSTNMKMREMFDLPEFSYVRYAAGSHPKHLWKEAGEWTEQRWEEFRGLLRSEKTVAVGEIGLDYSYKGLTPDHVLMQKEMFGRFIEEANGAGLPLVLHVRNKKTESGSHFGDADIDAIQTLKTHRPRNGAVLHCISDISDINLEEYKKVGVTHFGIGGRITYGWKNLIEAVKRMEEKMILTETDAPFLRVSGPSLMDKGASLPNTSLSLYDIAERIGEIRGCSTEHILQVSYENGMRLFRIKDD